MFETFLATLSPMLVLFICILVGFVLNKAKLLPENTGTVLSKLENYALVPAVSFSSFSQFCTVASLAQNGKMILYGAIAIAFAVGMAIVVSYAFKYKNAYVRNVFRYSLAFGNFGFVGNAIVPVILGGEEHLYMYLLFTLSLSFVVYLWGLPILTPKENRSGNALKNLLNVPFITLLIGAALGLLGVGQKLPAFVVSAIDSLKNCMGPIAMVLTGFTIANYSFKSLLSDKRVYVVAVLRLMILPAIIVTVLKLLGAPDYTLFMALFAFSTPMGLNTVVFPSAFGGDPKVGASMAMISHTVCVITIPIMYALLQAVLSVL